jgi:hypothetical protein
MIGRLQDDGQGHHAIGRREVLGADQEAAGCSWQVRKPRLHACGMPSSLLLPLYHKNPVSMQYAFLIQCSVFHQMFDTSDLTSDHGYSKMDFDRPIGRQMNSKTAFCLVEMNIRSDVRLEYSERTCPFIIEALVHIY